MIQRLLFFIVFCLTSWTLSAQLSTVTSVQLEFAGNNGTMVTATATDSGNGLAVDGSISLNESIEYTLSIKLFNGSSDITSEVTTNADQLQFFFDPSEGLLADSPSYTDMDANMLPIGLSSALTGNCTSEGDIAGTFRLALNDLGNQKTANSTINDGTSIFDLTWTTTVVDNPDAPSCENEEEVIDQVTLTFTPTDGGNPVVVVATDPDGSGLLDFTTPDINLDESKVYDLSIKLENTEEGEDITEEIAEEDDEHQFFFGFSEGVFDSPSGDGNIDNGSDIIIYNDMDDNGNPVGLSTSWRTSCTNDGNVGGTFRIILKHQPGAKTAMSDVNIGGTDLDIQWNINVVDNPDAPSCENEEEVIDQVTLTFTPTDGGNPVVVVATDPDGSGLLDFTTPDINLDESKVYDLSIKLENTEEGEDITEEIAEEDDEHQFFFGFSEGVFDSPSGDGNIDNGSDIIIYNDMDDNGNPVGLSTSWRTSCTNDGNVGGTFRIILKHQPGAKTAMSDVNIGGTDLDIQWNVNVVDNPDAPSCENEEEVIDQVTLTFAPTAGGDTIVVVATDPDGNGLLDFETPNVNLVEGTQYDMSIKLENIEEGEDITEEIAEEDDEHQFYFAWTGDIFSQPTGDGNIDNASDPVGYNDQDENGLPVGLSTRWTTSSAMSSGGLNIVLKHQPGIKSNASTAADGGTDLDITFSINAVVSSTNNLRPDQRLTIAPNPVQNNLYFLTRNVDLSQSTIVIFNSVGAQVRTLRNPNNEINISDLAPGMYNVLIQGEQLRWSGRFIKTNN